MARPVLLDALDWKILAELQADGSISNVELARRVGLTPPPCLRRVQSLVDQGIIRGFRALLDPLKSGFPVVCFAFVQLASQTDRDITRFREQVTKWQQVRECWTMSGDFDFLMKCVNEDLQEFQAFVAELTATPNVRNVRTALTLSLVKDEGMVPMVPGRGRA
jgi:DNA-binding Lrp family transcriptional regulator